MQPIQSLRRLWWPAASLAAVLGVTACSPNDGQVLQSAREHVAKQEFEAARVQLKGLLQKRADNGEARLLLGKLLLAQGDPAGAEAELRRALEHGQSEDAVLPSLAAAMLSFGKGDLLVSQYGTVKLKDDLAAAELATQLASAQFQANALPEAEAALAEALRRVPNHVPAQALSARLRAVRGDLDGAVADATALAKRVPGDAAVQALQGDLLMAKGKVDEALAAWRESLKLQPAQPAVHTVVMTALIGKRDVAAAEAQWAEMKKALPRHPQTQFFEAMLASNRGDYLKARDLTQALLRGAPENPRLLLLAGEAELKLNSPAQAETLFSKAVQVAPKLVAARRMLAQAQLQSHQPVKALATLAPLLESKPPDAEALALAGQAQLMSGNAKAADLSFAKAVELNPGNTGMRAVRALTRLGQGDDASAMNELESLAAKDKGDRVDLALIGARLQAGDLAGASKAVDKLAAKLPNGAMPEQLRGLLALNARDAAGARKHFDEAVRREPDYVPGLVKLAELDLAENKAPAARARFEGLLKRQPNSVEAMLALSDIAAQSGQDALVLEWLDKAIKAGPNLPMPRLMLVDRLLAQHKPDKALDAAQAGVAAVPDNGMLLERLGRVQLMTAHAEQAASTFSRLAALNPRSALPQLMLADAQNAAHNEAAVAAAVRRAQELAPELPQVAQAAVTQALREHKPEKAIAAARKLQTLKPKEPAGALLEGDVEMAQQHWDGAAVAYRRAIELGGKAPSPVAAVRLHQSLRKAGKTADADRVAAAWQASHAKDTVFPMYFGDDALVRKNLPEAERQFRLALDNEPGAVLAINNLAYVMALQGKAGGVALAEKALKLSPNQAALLDTLALAQEAENQLPAAVETQAKAVMLSPDTPQFRLQLARLRVKAGDKRAARDDLEQLAKLGAKFPRQAEVSELLKAVGG